LIGDDSASTRAVNDSWNDPEHDAGHDTDDRRGDQDHGFRCERHLRHQLGLARVAGDVLIEEQEVRGRHPHAG